MASRERLMSLDVFRGIAIAAMIVFANPGSWEHLHAPFQHADWHGWTAMDLPFPWFLFIVGTAISAALADGGQGRRTHLAILRRAVMLFALGLFLNGFPDHYQPSTLRIPGVLQRIALCYLAAALVVLHASIRRQVALTGALLVGYWLLLTFVPVPGFGAGLLTKEANLTAYVDRLIMPGHLYRGTWDPEGALSTLPALGTTMLGVLTGHWLRSARTPAAKTRGLLAAGIALTAAGRLLHPWVPLNKNLWTSSFVLFTAGTALLVLGVCFWVVDQHGYRRLATPLVALGRNAIAVYVLSNMVPPLMGHIAVPLPGGARLPLWTYLYTQVFAPWAGPKTGSLLQALAYMLLWVPPLVLLHRRRIWIKV